MLIAYATISQVSRLRQWNGSRNVKLMEEATMNNEMKTSNYETEVKEESAEVFQLRRLLSSIVLGNVDYKNYSEEEYKEFTERLEKLAKKYIDNGNMNILFDYADIAFVGVEENNIFSDEYAKEILKEKGLYSSYIEYFADEWEGIFGQSELNWYILTLIENSDNE